MIKRDNAMDVQAYLEYEAMVPGGEVMSEKEFELYKKDFPKLAANRLYANYYNPKGLLCKAVGPSSKCFCDHLFKNHDWLAQAGTKIKCKTAGCPCADYGYIPVHGSQDYKCSCKHSYQAHNVKNKSCKSCGCKEFSSGQSCSCKFKHSEHVQKHERKQALEQRGETVHQVNGGITSYAAMLDGADRFEAKVAERNEKLGTRWVELALGQEFKGAQAIQSLLSTPFKLR